MFFRKKLTELVDGRRPAREVITRIIDGAWKKKCLTRFTEGELIFWLLRWVRMEVSNGTIHQYLSNSTGDNYDEALTAFQTVGAHRAAEIFGEVRNYFPDGVVPKDRWVRNDLLGYGEEDEEWVRRITDELLDEFRAVDELKVAYAREHPDRFAAYY